MAAGRVNGSEEDRPLDVDVSGVWKIQVWTFGRFMQIWELEDPAQLHFSRALEPETHVRAW